MENSYSSETTKALKEIRTVAMKLEHLQKASFPIVTLDHEAVVYLCKRLKNSGFGTYISSGRLSIQRLSFEKK